MQAQLRRIWQDPASLNPAHISARVTRQVSDLLARLAKSIESNTVYEQNKPLALVNKAQVAPEHVASFLTRCLFSMFAEDVGLLPKEAFIGLLKTHRADPPTLRLMLQSLWADMDRGGQRQLFVGDAGTPETPGGRGAGPVDGAGARSIASGL